MKDFIQKLLIALLVSLGILGISSFSNITFPLVPIWKIYIFLVLGVFILYSLIQILYWGYKKILLKKKLGDKMLLEKLNSTFPNVKKIAVIGLAGVGKTTLIEHLCRKKISNETTRGKPSCYIHNFSNRATKYAALLDAAGQSLAQQVEIAKEADFLLLLFDHSDKLGDDDIEINGKRIFYHNNFLNQLIDALNNSKKKPSWIHILLNKEDLWSKNSDIAKLINFYEEVEEKLNNQFSSSIDITKEHHANPLSESITDILLTIEARLK